MGCSSGGAISVKRRVNMSSTVWSTVLPFVLQQLFTVLLFLVTSLSLCFVTALRLLTAYSSCVKLFLIASKSVVGSMYSSSGLLRLVTALTLLEVFGIILYDDSI